MLTRIRATILVAIISVAGFTCAGCSRGPYLAPSPRGDVYYENDGYYNNGPYYDNQNRGFREEHRESAGREGRHEEHEEHEGHR